MTPITDEQWLVLDLLVRAERKGVKSISHAGLARAKQLSVEARAKILDGALTMPEGYLTWRGNDEFAIAQAGIQAHADWEAEHPASAATVKHAVLLPAPT